ncbi:MAG: DUF4197 domain-containing protein [Gammaproteobacteria bacterium]|nr:DUF4197 domain-containing protein [Gammaproteobacteria bacterium]
MFNRTGIAVGMVAGLLFTAQGLNAGWQDLLKPISGALDNGSSATTGSPDVSSLSQQEMVTGLKEALSVGIERAIDLLGKSGGFLNDSAVKIPLPGMLQQVESGLRAMGQGELADEFIATMNHAAERAVPEAASIFGDTIKKMTLQDARGILQGADDSATNYFRENSGERLAQAISPIVKQATEKTGVTSAYKNMVGKAGFLSGMVDSSSLDIDKYVTDKTLDGLFLKLAAEERQIRENPLARSTDLLKKVFAN